MPEIKLKDGTVQLDDQGTGPPLLLVHGFPLDRSMWAGQLAELSQTARVLAPDLPGFGASGGWTLDGPLTMERLADTLAELLEALQIHEPVTFCGLSMGGYVAWQFWARHRTRLRQLVLCDTRAAADTPEAAAGREQTAQQVLRDGPAQLAENMLAKLFAPATAGAQPALLEATRAVMASAPSATVAAALRGMAVRRDMTPQLPQVDVPCLLVCGEHDAITPLQEMRSVADALPAAQLVAVPDAGHLAPLEQPAAVNSALREFL